MACSTPAHCCCIKGLSAQEYILSNNFINIKTGKIWWDITMKSLITESDVQAIIFFVIKYLSIPYSGEFLWGKICINQSKIRCEPYKLFDFV